MPGYRLPSSDGLRPVGDDVLAGFGRLVTARHLRRAGDGWQRRGSGCVYGPCGGHGRLADRTAAMMTPFRPWFDLVGSPASATLLLNAGPSRSWTEVTVTLLESYPMPM